MSTQQEADALVQDKDVLPLLLEADALPHLLQIKRIREMLSNYQNKLQTASQQRQTDIQQLQICLQNLVAVLTVNLVHLLGVQLNLIDQNVQLPVVQLLNLTDLLALDVQQHLLTTA